MIWQLIDRDTDAKNADIDWTFRVGDRVKIRLVNERTQTIRCRTPSTFTARAGSWCSRGGSRTNLVWKDTVLVLAGETVDILLYVTNPGRWMAHCHIAEHHQSGMMFSFNVEP